MQIWNRYFRGVEDIWLTLLLAVFALVFVTVKLLGLWVSHRAASRRQTGRLARLVGDEVGAAYMLPLALTVPFYVLLITMIVECTLMLAQKIGSVGAAYSAARAAAVWLPYETAMPKEAPDYTPLEDRQAMVQLAAARAMWPYASGSEVNTSSTQLDDLVEETIAQQIDAFQNYSGDSSFKRDYLKRKFIYAFNSSSIEIAYLDPTTEEVAKTPLFNSTIQLTLRYEAPIHTFGIGRLFGEKSKFGNFYVRPILTTVTIENEGVKRDPNPKLASKNKVNKSLGIKYYERHNVTNRPAVALGGSASNTRPTNNSSTSASGNNGTNSVNQSDSERHQAEVSLAQLEQQYAQATGEQRNHLRELIEDYRIALGLSAGKPYTGEVSWFETPNAPSNIGPHFHIYVLEDRLGVPGVGINRGRTFVQDVRTGEVYLYQHFSGGASNDATVKNPFGVDIGYAELQGDAYYEGFNPQTSMSTGLGADTSVSVLAGYVIQQGPLGSTLQGAQIGTTIGGAISYGPTGYRYSGSYPSLQSAGYGTIWSKPKENVQFIPAPE